MRKRPYLDLYGLHQDDRILKFIDGRKAAIWGAGHQALATMRLLNLDSKKIQYVVDSSASKQGRYTPVTHIPIVPPNTLKEHPVEALVILCGSYSKEVETLAADYKVPNVFVA